MPKNRFPDTLSKRELRRRDSRSLATFKSQQELPLGLEYCGMPSVEFLDIREWQDRIRSVCAVELDPDVLWDMRIEWDRLGLNIPIRFVDPPTDIIDFIHKTDECYDLYNLDFYGGFLHPNQQGAARCIEGLRSMIARQSAKNRSFVLVCTFNVRDKGFSEYMEYIDKVPQALAGWRNVEECCREHTKNQATRLKLCFPFFCCQTGFSNGFVVRFADTIVYRSSATLIHFYAEFIYQSRSLPPLIETERLADLANRPLLRLDGMIPRVDMTPPGIVPP